MYTVRLHATSCHSCAVLYAPNDMHGAILVLCDELDCTILCRVAVDHVLDDTDNEQVSKN